MVNFYNNTKEIIIKYRKIIVPIMTFSIGIIIGLLLTRSAIYSKNSNINVENTLSEELVSATEQIENSLTEKTEDVNMLNADISTSVYSVVRVYDGEVQYYDEGQWLVVDSIENFIQTDPFIQYDLARVAYETALLEEKGETDVYGDLFTDENLSVGTVNNKNTNGNTNSNVNITVNTNLNGATETPVNQTTPQNNGSTGSTSNNGSTNNNAASSPAQGSDPVANTPTTPPSSPDPAPSNPDPAPSDSGSSDGGSPSGDGQDIEWSGDIL